MQSSLRVIINMMMHAVRIQWQLFDILSFIMIIAVWAMFGESMGSTQQAREGECDISYMNSAEFQQRYK